MSWRVANTCAERKFGFGSATRKQIIMFLADKASDDGSGIWCSKGTIQRHTELGETTVKRTVREFLKEGILVETGARTCKNGFTVVYRIDLTKVEALEPTLEPEIETGSTVAPVQSGPGTGATVAGVPGPPRPRRRTCCRPSKPTPPTAQGSRVPRSAFPTTGFSRGAGRDTSRTSVPSGRRPKLRGQITTRGWPAGSATAVRCANTSRPRRSRRCLPQSW